MLHQMSHFLDQHSIDLVSRVFPPSTMRPRLDVPRFWSNPGLDDPDRIIALVLERPSIEDLARIIVAYGGERVLRVLDDLKKSGEFTSYQHGVALDLVGSAIRGVADAARELASE